MGKQAERQRELIDILRSRGILPIKTLSGMLGVSEMTVRRDLDALQSRSGAITDASGDALAFAGEYNLLDEVKRAYEQKDRIGKFAASLIEMHDVVIIDTGSTTARMLPYVPENQDLTVLCYNANVLFQMLEKQGVQVLFGGGVYHENTEMFESPESLHFIRRMRANKAFLSAAGIHRELGITCANDYEIATKYAVIHSSDEKILVADSYKFGRLRSSHFCEFSDITQVITDQDLSAEWRDFLTDKGLVLHLV